MSIENNLASIAQSLAIIAQHLINNSNEKITHTAVVDVPTVAAVPVPVASISVPVPVAVAVPVPAFVAPVAVQNPVQPDPSVPFNDKQGLTQYTMSVYKSLGAVKGGEIQNVLVALGVTNINEVTPAMYGQYYAALEALKVS
jgi:hypothetical protein